MFTGGTPSRYRSSLVATLVLTVLLLAPPSADPVPLKDLLAPFPVQSFREPIPAPPLSLEDSDGHSLRLTDLQGNVVFLNFWATWCAPCRQEMPAMERLYRDYRERGLAVVGVNFKESRAEIQSFLKELSLSFPAVLDPEGTAARTFGVRGLPVTFLLGRDGRILWRAIGSREWDSPAGRAYFDMLLQARHP